jgi:hypothetical protein
MDPAQIKFIRKALNKERGAEVLEKTARPPSFESSLKIPRHFVQLLAVVNSEMNFQSRNEIHRTIGRGGTCASFFKGWTELPHSLCRAASVFALFSKRPGPARPATGIIVQMPISRKSLLQVESVRRLPMRRPSLLKTVVSIKSREPVTVTNYEMVNQPPSLPPGTCNCDHSSGAKPTPGFIFWYTHRNSFSGLSIIIII